MRIIDILDDLHNSGDLRTLISVGIVPPLYNEWRKMYHLVNYLVNEKKVQKSQAVVDVSDAFRISERHLYNVLKSLNSTY